MSGPLRARYGGAPSRRYSASSPVSIARWRSAPTSGVSRPIILFASLPGGSKSEPLTKRDTYSGSTALKRTATARESLGRQEGRAICTVRAVRAPLHAIQVWLTYVTIIGINGYRPAATHEFFSD